MKGKKSMRKLVSILLALIMVMGMSSAVFAAENTATNGPSITIGNPDSEHTYEAYQIFKGTVKDNTLSNIQWGTGISEAGQTALQNKYNANSAAKVAESLNENNAVAFSKEVAKYLVENQKTTLNSSNSYSVAVDAGYYLIKDGNIPEGTNQAHT